MDIISTSMPISAILEQLQKRDIEDVTTGLNLDECGQRPFANGGGGDVYRGKLQNGRAVALKTLRFLAGTGDDEKENKKQFTRAAEEIYIWSKCKHPNVLQLIGFAEYQSQLAIVSPWMDKGQLNRFLSESANSGVAIDVYNMCAQIADGVAYLHSQKLVHGDIKGANILVSSGRVPKLADFGSATLSKYSLQFTGSAGSGRSYSLQYASPEIVIGADPTTKGDVYSLGMTVLEAITRSLPYGDIRDSALYFKKLSKAIPRKPETGMPKHKEDADILWNLLLSCWADDPNARPTASKVADELRGIQCTIDRKMSLSQILKRLNLHGCKDMTKVLGDVDPQPVEGQCDGSTCYDLFRHEKLALRCPSLEQGPGQFRRRPDLALELYIWSRCEHPNILRLRGATQIRGKLAMVSPWINRGTLDLYVKRREVDRCKMCIQLAEAVAYLHSKSIAHGNIKMSNILVSLQSDTKLIGFSYARMYKYNDLRFSGLQARGDPLPAWVAPENQDDKPYVATYKADIYALGKTILEILLRGQPGYKTFGPSPNAPRIPKRPERYLPPDNEQADRLWSLLKRCWSRNPDDRPKAFQIKNAIKNITDEGLWGSTSESEEVKTTEEETREDETGNDDD